jgi:hypothetical protein
MLFHVVNKESGVLIQPKGEWAITADGSVIDVIDGWGCEGGGGSNDCSHFAHAVFGPAPIGIKTANKPPVPKTHCCTLCNKRFVTVDALNMHIVARHS